MESRIQKTIELHDKGYNCAQAVACAYCDLVDIDERTALRATEAFGAGMGGRETTCGAISGAVFLAGLKGADGIVGAPKSKASTYKLSKTIVDAFQKKNGTVICKELKEKILKRANRDVTVQDVLWMQLPLQKSYSSQNNYI